MLVISIVLYIKEHYIRIIFSREFKWFEIMSIYSILLLMMLPTLVMNSVQDNN